jgi:20S proteasome subunit alpha 5
VPSSIKKLVKLDHHIGCAVSGLVADSRTLVDHARVETQHHWFVYDEKMSVQSTVQSVCDLALDFGGGSMARPFGVALLVAGVDEKGPCLYHTDPSGTYTKYMAKAIGAGSEGAQSQLQEHYNKSMKLHEAQKLALEILKQVMEEKLNSTNVEVAVITTEEQVFRLLEKDDLEAIIKTLDEPVV